MADQFNNRLVFITGGSSGIGLALAKQFAAHTIDRRYKAIVGGRPMPPAGKVDAPLARSPRVMPMRRS